jgi:hypothetical protein
MLNWVVPVVASVVGAGAGSFFNLVFSKPPRIRKFPLPALSSDVRKSLEQIHEWEESVEELVEAQQRQILRLRREIRTTRYVLDVFLVLLLAACVMYYWVNR